jgi:hypothetical protein
LAVRYRYHQLGSPSRRLRVSFLDRLKREADQQRQQAEQQALERDQRETQYRSQIEPKMKALLTYLEGLVATLLEVRPAIVVRMAIQGYGELCVVPFFDYKIEHERRHRSLAITMTWSMKVDGERTPIVRADGVTRVKALTSIFRQYHLGGIKEEKRTPQGELSCATFHARGYIKARMEATISADDPVLRLIFENASWLGASRRQVPWEQIDDDLFDRIARFIVREDDSLFTEELSDALKQKLRKEPQPAAAATPARAPAPSPREAAPPAAVADAPIAARPAASELAVPKPAPEPSPVAAQAPVATAAIAQLTQGEMIEIDESKLGLADFMESDQPPSVFSADAMRGAAPAPKLGAPALTGAIGTIPAPPPVAGGEVIAIDESKLGFDREPAPIAIERVPMMTPTPPSMPATAAAPPPVAATAQPRQNAAARPTAPATTPQLPAETAVQRAAAPQPRPAAVEAAPSESAAGESAPTEETQERDAALFRLRMRAMMARLRSDETGDAKG